MEIVPLYPLGRSEQLGIKHPQFIAKAFRGAVPDTAEALSKEKLSDWVTAGGYQRLLSGIANAAAKIGTVPTSDRLSSAIFPKFPIWQSLIKFRACCRSRAICRAVDEPFRNRPQRRTRSQDGRPLSARTGSNSISSNASSLGFATELSRLVKTPRLHFIDSGLLTAMRGHSLSRLRADRTLFGALLKSFVFSEFSSYRHGRKSESCYFTT